MKKTILSLLIVLLSTTFAIGQEDTYFCYNTEVTFKYNGDKWVPTKMKEKYDCVTLPGSPGELVSVEHTKDGLLEKGYVAVVDGKRVAIIYTYRKEFIYAFRVMVEGNDIAYGYYFERTRS